MFPKEGRGESDFFQDLRLSRQSKHKVPGCSGTSLARLTLVFHVSVDIRHLQEPRGFLRVLQSPESRASSKHPAWSWVFRPYRAPTLCQTGDLGQHVGSLPITSLGHPSTPSQWRWNYQYHVAHSPAGLASPGVKPDGIWSRTDIPSAGIPLHLGV